MQNENDNAFVDESLVFLAIELEALKVCMDRLPENFEGILGEEITDADYRAGIHNYFAEIEGMTDEDVETVLWNVKENIEFQESLNGLASAMVGSMMSGDIKW